MDEEDLPNEVETETNPEANMQKHIFKEVL